MVRGAALLTAMLLVLVACGGAAGSGSSAGPIKIGLLGEVTGEAAANSKDLINGWNLGIQDAGGSVNGRKIDTKVADEAFDPNRGLSAARQLVEQQHIDFLVGPQAANVALAVRPYVASSGIPSVFPGCGIEPTRGHVTPNVVLTGWTCDQPSLVFGKYVHDTLGYKHITTVGMDYAFGWQVIGGFLHSYKKAGGTVDKQIWTPISTPDFAPYMSQIPTNTDAVFALMAGANAPKFTDAYLSYGLKGKVPLIGNGTLTDYSVLPSESPNAAMGVVTNLQYADGVDNPENKKFVSEVRSKLGKFPSYYVEDGYTTAKLVMAALKQVNGNANDHSAVVNALRHATADAPRGQVTIDATTNSPTQNVYISKVEQVNGSLRNVPVATIKQVHPWGSLSQSEWEQIANGYSRGSS